MHLWKGDKKLGQAPPPSLGQNPKEQQFFFVRTSLRYLSAHSCNSYTTPTLNYMCAMWKRSFFSIMSCSNSICVLTRSILVLRSVAVPVGIHEVMKCTAEEIVLDKNMGKLPTLSDRMTHGAMHVISKQTILQRFLWFDPFWVGVSLDLVANGVHTIR